MVTIGFALSVVGALTSGDTWLQRALRQFDELDASGRRRLTVARAYLAGQQGDASRSLGLLEGFVPLDSDDDIVVATPALEVHARGWLHDFVGARDAAARSRRLRPLGVVYDEIMVGGALSWVVCMEGSLREAEQLADKALATADELSLQDHSMLGEALRTRGWLRFERGDLGGAEAALERSVMLLEKPGPARSLVSTAALARVWLSDGRLQDATEALSTARACLSPEVASPLWAVLDGLDARIALVQGDRERAKAITQLLAPSLRRRRLEARRELAEHDPAAALAALESSAPVTPRERVDAFMLRARCDDELGSADADRSLADAVEAARLEGFAFSLAEELFPCARRLGAFLRSAPMDPFAIAVLDLLEHVVPLPEPAARTALVEPLTDREVMVLRYMTSRLTTSEIAKELYISVNTVRTHTKAVYRKLGVASRQDAVTEAHRLGIR